MEFDRHSRPRSIGEELIAGLEQLGEALKRPAEGTMSVPAGTDVREIARLMELNIGVHQIRIKDGQREGERDVYPATFELVFDREAATLSELPDWISRARFTTAEGISSTMVLRPRK